MRPRREPDPYVALGLAPGASRAEVRRAYRRRALAVHPDVAGVDSTDDMARLNRARDELLGRPRDGDPVGASADAGAPNVRPRPDRPTWAAAYAAAWTDYWSAWNELPQRDRQAGTGSDGWPPGESGDPRPSGDS
jgi:hypothetical protein